MVREERCRAYSVGLGRSFGEWGSCGHLKSGRRTCSGVDEASSEILTAHSIGSHGMSAYGKDIRHPTNECINV